MVDERSSATGGPRESMAALDVRDASRDGNGSGCELDATLAAVIAPVPVPALVVCPARGTVIWANAVACSDELSRAVLRGRPIAGLFDPSDRPSVELLIASMAAGASEPRHLVATVTLPGRLPQRYATTWVAVPGSPSSPDVLVYLHEVATLAGEPIQGPSTVSVPLDDAESVVCGADGIIRWVSPATVAVLEDNGFSPQDLLGTSILELGSPAFRVEAKAIHDEVLSVPGTIVTRTLHFGDERDPAQFVVHAQNRLADPEIGGVVWWRRRVDPSRDGRATLEQRLAVLERTLESISRELQTAGFTPQERRVPYWRRIPGAELLNEREERVVDLLAQGLRVPSIAQRLYVSQSTVRNNLSAIYRKLGVVSQVQLLELLVAEETLDPEEA